MMELLQALVCIWETLLPVVAADRVLDRRRMVLPVKILWYICIGANAALLVYQRYLVMYSRLYLIFSIILTYLLLIWRYNRRKSRIGLAVWSYYESIYVLDLFGAILLSYFYDELFFFSVLLREITQERLCVYVISRMVVSGIVYIFIFRKKLNAFIYHGIRMFWVIPIILHLGLVQCDIVFLGITSEELGKRNLYFYLIFFVLVFCIFIIYWMKQSNAYEKKLLEEKMRLLESDCQRILLWNRERDILIHDMKNHYITLGQLLKEKETERAFIYVEAMLHSIQNVKSGIRSGNIVIDAILGDRMELAQKEQIRMQVVTDDLSDTFVSDQDWCIILSNMADNAIEASKSAGDKEIEISIEKRTYGIVLKMKNSSSKAVDIRDGVFVSSKAEKKGHGLGMKSVQKVLDKYDGTMQCEYADQMVKIDIVLYPMAEQQDI